MKPESTRPSRDKRKPIISIAGMSVSTQAITLKTTHLDLFRREAVKTRIFILQIDNKIADAIETLKKRKIRYMMSLLRKVTAE